MPQASWLVEWPDTDFSIASVEFSEIMSGGVPKDGIPSISGPTFVDASDADMLPEREPVMTLEIPGERPRAYPVRYLLWHEIVNDLVGQTPVAVTYCPLCNSGVVFDRRLDDKTLTFGVSGKLRHSDMVMYDRETESWWQQSTGEAIVGELTGDTLVPLAGWTESWREFQKRNPDGLVMEAPDHPRRYGANPYVGYDTSNWPFLFTGSAPPHGLAPLARVVRVGDFAWPLARLRREGVISEHGVQLTWSAGQASAVDARTIADSRDVGTVRVKDIATGEDLPHDLLFAFAYDALFPEGKWAL
ncbi:MAG: DUF3179 domain-containing protein [Rhodobacteraceae bacterium]|nr:DUF3179 domain-containing protein [Paracoccaceae bacterium]